jgi:hypothetical protein
MFARPPSFPTMVLSRAGRNTAIYATGVLLVVVGVLVVTLVYVATERTFYTWDFHEYSTRLETSYAQLTHSPLTALVQIYLSTSQEYNLIPTIPLLPLRALLDGSRTAFEVDLAAVFIVPFVLAVGWVGSRTIAGPRTAVFWTTVAVALAIPFTWVSIMRGFADLGAAAVVAVAIGLYVADQRLTRPWRPVAIGVLLASAFLFRRPFAYDGVAFIAAILLVVLARAAVGASRDARRTARVLVFDISRLALIGLSGAVTLVAIGHRLVGKLLIEDYGALYRSYVRPPAEILAWLGGGFGWLIVILAGAGFVLSFGTSKRGSGVRFVGLYGLLLAIVWVGVVGQEGVHYAVHFIVPLAIGLTALGWWLWRLSPSRLGRPAVAMVVLLLAVNLAAGLTPWLAGNRSIARALLAESDPPMVRTDYDEMLRLVADIREAAGSTKAVLVIGSTDGFSDDTVKIADDVSRGDKAPLLVLTSPHVDSRDQYPLAVLLGADVVVEPDPLPIDLAPDQQGVQRILHDLFVQGSEGGAGFRALPGTYELEGGIGTIRVRVLVRVRPTSLPEAEADLVAMRKYTPVVPPNQVPWVSVGGLDEPLTDLSGNRPPVIVAGRDGQGQWVANSLIYVGAGASTSITGSVDFLDRTCAGIDLRLTSIDGTLSAPPGSTISLVPGGETSFNVANLGGAAADLLFEPTQHDPQRPCAARIALTDVANDRNEAKSLLLIDQGSGTTP